MKKFGTYLVSALFCSILSSCATTSLQQNTRTEIVRTKNIEHNAILSDPIIKSDFRNLKRSAMSARGYRQDNDFSFTDSEIKKLNTLSVILIDRLRNHYHLRKYKIHTFIASAQDDACYRFFDSAEKNYKLNPEALPQDFPNYRDYSQFMDLMRSRNQKIFHLNFQSHPTTILVDKFILKNGERAYLALAIT